MSARWLCCRCCEGVAQDDHVEHGGSIEMDSHEGPCTVCHQGSSGRASEPTDGATS